VIPHGEPEVAVRPGHDPRAGATASRRDRKLGDDACRRDPADLVGAAFGEPQVAVRARKVSGISRRLGEIGGIEAHFVRAYSSFVNELLVLIRKNPDATSNPYFQSVLAHVRKDVREGWETLVQAANGHWEDSKLGKALVTARSNVGYHYVAGEIGKGYRRAFIDRVVRGARTVPMLSRGGKPARARFYFADLAVQGYLAHRFGDNYHL
jgi:hypothetical protein